VVKRQPKGEIPVNIKNSVIEQIIIEITGVITAVILTKVVIKVQVILRRKQWCAQNAMNKVIMQTIAQQKLIQSQVISD